MNNRQENVLVTGGAGFIGSRVAKELKTCGYTVVVLDDLSGGFKENIPAGIKFVRGSINDVALLSEIFERHRFHYVFHLAAYAAEGLSHFIKRFNYMNNVVGSVNLINESVKHHVRCFVFTSSIAVYGTNQLPLTEDMIPMPEDSYGIAKLAVELELKASWKMFGLDYIIFRPHNVYGEYQNIGDKYRNVVGIFMNNVMQNKPLAIFGDGSQTRAFTYINDVAPIIARAIEHTECYGEIFNIGAKQPHTINDLAQIVMKTMRKKVDVIHLKERNEVKHAYCGHNKLEKFFGRPQYVDLKEGTRRMALWVKKTGVRKSVEFKNIEIYKNLPASWKGKAQ